VRKAFQSSPAEVDSRIAGFRRVWLVRSHSYSEGVLDALKGVLAERSRRTFPKQNGIEVIRLERVDL
jgi:hypothetical protein